MGETCRTEGQDWQALGWSKPKSVTNSTSEPVIKAGKQRNAAAKLAAATEAGALPKVSLATRQRISQARAAKGWTQAKLAKAVNVTQRVINDYEAGKALPDGAVLAKLGRHQPERKKGKNRERQNGNRSLITKRPAPAPPTTPRS